MISSEEKIRIKEIIGHRYVASIQKELKDSEEFNSSGEPYSAGHITNVMNGEQHRVIEDAIFRVVARRQYQLEKRKGLLNKKSAAVTADS